MDLADLWALESELVRGGWVDLSDYWKDLIRSVYDSPAQNVVIRGGRRGGKSTSVCRIAAAELLFGHHYVPPGDVGYFAIISAERPQAKERLNTIKQILETLDVPHKATTEEIRIDGRNLAVRCFTASLSGVVSFTCIGALCDEEARWRDRDTGANPAKEVLASLRPTMATQPNARIWHVSSPWSTLDVHYEMVELGNTESQIVFDAPTWVMNPTISKAKTKILEPDEATWRREYAAIPMSGDSSKFFNAATVGLAQIEKPTPHEIAGVFAGADFAFRRNSSALVLVEKCYRDGQPYFSVLDSQERIPGESPLSVSETIGEFSEIATESGAGTMCCDLHYIESVYEVLEEVGDMSLIEFPNTQDAKIQSHIRARVLLARGQLDLSRASDKLISQLKQVESKPTENGMQIRNKTVGNEHGDLVSALIAALYSAEIPEMKMSSTRKRRFSGRRFGESIGSGWSEFAPTD